MQASTHAPPMESSMRMPRISTRKPGLLEQVSGLGSWGGGHGEEEEPDAGMAKKPRSCSSSLEADGSILRRAGPGFGG